MAKVTMPLLSGEASGKIANAMVFFYWKGRNVVRKWVVPTNPRDPDQKLARTKLATIGKVLAAITTPTAAIIDLIKAETPAGMIWNAHLCKQFTDHVKTAANWTTVIEDWTQSTCIDQWTDSAGALGMADLPIGDAFSQAMEKGLQLFAGAYAAYKLALCNLGSYTLYPKDWTTGMVTNFAKDLTAA